MKALMGRKLGMTQTFDTNGQVTPVTLVQAGPCIVAGVRTLDKDGYEAVQLGFETAKSLKKAQAGQFQNLKAKPRYIKEVRGSYDVTVGDTIDVSVFENDDLVTITGTGKGKGFSGTIKRHNFSRGPMSHGSRSKRRPGSIGSMYPQKIFKGKKMAGRHGGATITDRNMKVAAVDPEQNLLAIKGALPGSRGSLVVIRGEG